MTTTAVDAPVETTPEKSGEGAAYLLAALLLGLWAASIAVFGFAGFFMPAVIAAPICLIMLVIISRG